MSRPSHEWSNKFKSYLHPTRRDASIFACVALVVLSIIGALAISRDDVVNVRQIAQVPLDLTPDASGNPVAGVTATTSPVAGIGESSTPTSAESAIGSQASTNTTSTSPSTAFTTPTSIPAGAVATPGTTPAVSSPTDPSVPLNITTPTGSGVSVVSSANVIDSGTSVTFSALVTDRSGGIKRLDWDYGDGQTSEAQLPSCDDPAYRPTLSEGRTEFPSQTSHAFKSPGTYLVRATATTGTRCGAKATDEVISGVVAITVRNGSVATNGLSFPTLSVTPGPGGLMPEDPHATVSIKTSDSDGYISRIVIDWDDPGSSLTVLSYPLSECRDTPFTWPSSERSAETSHDYITAGTYNVTVTVTSVGCDGQSSQEAIGSLQIVNNGTVVTTTPAAAPSPSTTESVTP